MKNKIYTFELGGKSKTLVIGSCHDLSSKEMDQRLNAALNAAQKDKLAIPASEIPESYLEKQGLFFVDCETAKWEDFLLLPDNAMLESPHCKDCKLYDSYGGCCISYGDRVDWNSPAHDCPHFYEDSWTYALRYMDKITPPFLYYKGNNPPLSVAEIIHKIKERPSEFSYVLKFIEALRAECGEKYDEAKWELVWKRDLWTWITITSQKETA